MNDFLLETDNQKVILMGFLDLSAAFDTVDHCILLHRLEKMFGIEDKALDWFRTYLTGRTQSVVVGDCESHKKVIQCCIPQGSGLGLISTANIHYLLVSLSGCFTYFSTCMLMMHRFTNQLTQVILKTKNKPWNNSICVHLT